jgi:hypothetical protein
VAYTIVVLFSLLFMVSFCSLYTLQIGGTFQDARKILEYKTNPEAVMTAITGSQL